MELKMKYQYTYFIHPFIIKENRYQKYILKLIRDKNFKLKVFQKEKDLRLYQYFLPKVSEFLFSSFSFSTNKIKKLEELPDETKTAILSKYPCTIFEYSLKKDIQGKTEEKGIFFQIQKIEVMCFSSGICFLVMKTNMEETESFADLLNFNYKFKGIYQDYAYLNSYDNIHLQTDSFSDISKLTDFIKHITGTNLETMKLDIDTQNFLTYSYVCLDQQVWNNETNFESMEYNFVKFSNFLPADNAVQFEKDSSETFSKWKFARLGMHKQGITLFTSASDMNNYTILPDEFEREYLYTYLLNLYKKMTLKKLEKELKVPASSRKSRKKFIEFTKRVWMQEVTEEEVGSKINFQIAKVLELEGIYQEVKNQYDVFYKELNIQKNTKSMWIVAIILMVSLIFNVLNYIALWK